MSSDWNFRTVKLNKKALFWSRAFSWISTSMMSVSVRNYAAFHFKSPQWNFFVFNFTLWIFIAWVKQHFSTFLLLILITEHEQRNEQKSQNFLERGKWGKFSSEESCLMTYCDRAKKISSITAQLEMMKQGGCWSITICESVHLIT